MYETVGHGGLFVKLSMRMMQENSQNPAPFGVNDNLIWHFSKDGRYAVKSSYHLAFQIIDDVWIFADLPWKLLWRFVVPPKEKVFYWCLCKGYLAVRARLHRWYSNMEREYPLCGDFPEMTWHLFVDCVVAKECWVVARLWEEIESLIFNVEGHGELFLSMIGNFERAKMQLIMMVGWALWRLRNSLVWSGTGSNVSRCVTQEPLSSLAQCTRTTLLKVAFAGVGEFKVNVDASFFEDTMVMGVGMILHDDIGEFVACRTLKKNGLFRVDEDELRELLR